MVTLADCIYATIYYAYYKIKTLLPMYKNNILFCKRIFRTTCSVSWHHLMNKRLEKLQINPLFGILEWEVEERTTSVNFIDLTISINKDRKIETRTYQKAMNIYPYLPPIAAHPLSIICGMISGMLRKYDEHTNHQNTTSKWQCFYSEHKPRAYETPHLCNKCLTTPPQKSRQNVPHEHNRKQ